MFNFKHLARRVSIAHENRWLVINIQQHNDRALYVGLLLCFTIIFGFLCSVFVPAFFRAESARQVLYLLPFTLFFGLWYFLSLRLGLWRAFGVEKIAISQGALLWERKALWWKRKLEVAGSDITDIVAKTPWHGLSNRVEFTLKGKTYRIGDMILRDEANEIVRDLRSAIPVSRMMFGPFNHDG
jgi:hypothetical protein